MAEVNPPLFLTVDSAYGGDELGLWYRDLVREGVIGDDSLEVTTASDGLKINVAAGACAVKGDSNADSQPTYRCRSDASVELTHTTADGSNARIDRVVARVKDSAFAGGEDKWELAIIAGTPAASPAAPAEPDTAITLALVTIAAGATIINSEDISDRRELAGIGGELGLLPSDLEQEDATDEQALMFDTSSSIWRPKTILPSDLGQDGASDGDVLAWDDDNSVYAPAARSLVTEVTPGPPSNPSNGDYWLLAVTDQSDIFFWEFRYSSAVDKWLFVGGPAMRAEVDAAQALSSTGAYRDLATVGPSLTVPRAGTYDIHFGCRWDPSAINQHGRMSISINGVAATDADAAVASVPQAEASTELSVMAARRKTIAGAHTVVAKYDNPAGGGAIFSHRWMEITPVQINPA